MTGLSICQIIVEADCMLALMEERCPNDCGSCLHHQRFERDNANWLPEGKDVSDFPEACRRVETAGEELDLSDI